MGETSTSVETSGSSKPLLSELEIANERILELENQVKNLSLNLPGCYRKGEYYYIQCDKCGKQDGIITTTICDNCH